MTKELFRNFVQKADELEETQEKLRQYLMGYPVANEPFEKSAVIQGRHRTLGEFFWSVSAIAALAKKVSSNSLSLLIPTTHIVNAAHSLDNIKTHINNALNTLNSHKNSIVSFEFADYSFRIGNGQSVQIVNHLSQADQQLDNLLSHIHPIIITSKYRGTYDLTKLHEAYEKAAGTISTLIKEAKSDADTVSSYAEAAEIDYSELETRCDKSKKLESEITGISDVSVKSKAAIQEQVAKIEEITKTSATLKNTVNDYQSNFDSFQNQLDQRNKEIDEGSKGQKTLTQQLQTLLQQVEQLNDQAEGMLSGATVAGLSSSFGERRDKLDDELASAREAFYKSMWFLGGSVVVVALLIIPDLGAIWDYLVGFLPSDTPENIAEISDGEAADSPPIFGQSSDVIESRAPITISQVISRALILIPGIWLAQFTAARHSALFKLKEHYSYKYSIASSVEGFKKQAEGYESEIAATAFHELTVNPAEQMGKPPHPKRKENPLMRWLLRRVEKNFENIDNE